MINGIEFNRIQLPKNQYYCHVGKGKDSVNIQTQKRSRAVELASQVLNNSIWVKAGLDAWSNRQRAARVTELVCCSYFKKLNKLLILLYTFVSIVSLDGFMISELCNTVLFLLPYFLLFFLEEVLCGYLRAYLISDLTSEIINFRLNYSKVVYGHTHRPSQSLCSSY